MPLKRKGDFATTLLGCDPITFRRRAESALTKESREERRLALCAVLEMLDRTLPDVEEREQMMRFRDELQRLLNATANLSQISRVRAARLKTARDRHLARYGSAVGYEDALEPRIAIAEKLTSLHDEVRAERDLLTENGEIGQKPKHGRRVAFGARLAPRCRGSCQGSTVGAFSCESAFDRRCRVTGELSDLRGGKASFAEQ